MKIVAKDLSLMKRILNSSLILFLTTKIILSFILVANKLAEKFLTK